MSEGVSVIVPCYSERDRIIGLLDALLEQSVGSDRFELLIVDGQSQDGTREVIGEFLSRDVELNAQVIENPAQTIPAALNRGVESSSGAIVVRLDAHSAPAFDYIERCLAVLQETQAANVGGVWQIEAGDSGWIAESIAAAAAHPLGAGDARYRISGEAGPVDTVPFGAFRREWIEKVGPFNESLLTNEDYEYNVRIRRAGGTVWFDPSIRSTYYARATFGELARQYARYGYWKAQMLRMFPSSLRWRQLLPPLFVVASVLLLGMAIILPSSLTLLAWMWAVYGSVLLLAGIQSALGAGRISRTLGIPLSLMTMHICWGGAFLVGLLARAEPA